MDLDRWWNNKWDRRGVIGTQVGGSPHNSGIHFLRLNVDLSQLVANGLVQNDYSDIRIICQKYDHCINIPYYIVDETDPFRIFFSIQHNAASGDIFENVDQEQYYYLYYHTSYYTEEIPDNYVNINFPQAPYSCHGSGYDTTYGKYQDKHFLRLNDDPSDGNKFFEDETGHAICTNGDLAGDGVCKGYSGVLSQSTYFKADIINTTTPSGSFIEIPQNVHNHWGHPSGNWAVDFWFKPYAIKGSNPYGYAYSAILSKPESDSDLGSFPKIYQYMNRAYNNVDIRAECRVLSAVNITQRSERVLPSGEWGHVRVAYRTGGDYTKSLIHIYCNGEKSETITVGENQALYLCEPASIWIGWNYNNNTDNHMYHGLLEQLRYSTFVYPAMSGVNDYECSPDWVNEQYECQIVEQHVGNSVESTFGGILKSDVLNSVSGIDIIGGIINSREGETHQLFGGVYSSVTAPFSGIIGGYLKSAVKTSGLFAGLMLSSYGDVGSNIIDSLNRTLIKSNADTQNKQQFEMNAQYTLYQLENNDFNAKVAIRKTFNDNFDALTTVEKKRNSPFVEIIDTNLVGHNYEILASGHAFNRNNISYNSGICNVLFIWGDNDYTEINDPINSGFLWKANHTYTHSGIYNPVVRIVDKNSRVGSDSIELYLAPSGISLPQISLSGTPRNGYIPLTVDFNVITSGVVGSYTLFWDFCNGMSYYSNAKNHTVQYMIEGEYSPFVRLVDNSGIYVSDTLKIGYNR